jgi:hypothetical protein
MEECFQANVDQGVYQRLCVPTMQPICIKPSVCYAQSKTKGITVRVSLHVRQIPVHNEIPESSIVV